MAKLCVIGPLDIGQYSKSPLIHTFLLKQAKIKGKYLAIGSTNLPTTIKQLIHQKYHGFNLTIPHKIAILPCLNKIDHAAQKIGAVNTVKIIDGKLFGYNTDASGAVAYLADKINIKKIKHPLIIGAGGAARALIYGLKYIQKINDITILNRTDKKAQLLAKEFKIKCCK
jgi:shikimate dehydrogenase